MKSASASLITLLNGNNVFMMADLFTFTLLGGQVYRWTPADTNIVLAGNTFLSTGPLLKRGKTRTVVGIEVDTLDVTIMTADPAEGPVQILGVPVPQAAANGAFDGARVKLERVFMPTWGDTTPGSIVLFEGAVSAVDPSHSEVKLTVKSELERLNLPMPHTTYKPACSHALYNAGCGLSKASFTVAGTVTGSPTTTTLASALGQASGYFNLGVLTMTSGAASGARRAVKGFSGGTFTLALPLPVVPAPGDTFSVYPGCDKIKATCQTKFNNVNRFRGYPYVPRPEQAR